MQKISTLELSPLPFEDNSLDLVYCSEVVEHLEQPEQLFLEIHRVLQPGAFLILTTPNEPNIFQRSFYSKQRRERIHDEIRRQSIVVNMGNGTSIPIHGHVSLKTIREWDGLLADRGFELVAYRRGAIGYGAGSVFDHEFSLWLRFAMETLIDLLPLKLGRLLSDELIALYQKSTY
jgi:SAM-dependent methyltransferase